MAIEVGNDVLIETGSKEDSDVDGEVFEGFLIIAHHHDEIGCPLHRQQIVIDGGFDWMFAGERDLIVYVDECVEHVIEEVELVVDCFIEGSKSRSEVLCDWMGWFGFEDEIVCFDERRKHFVEIGFDFRSCF